MEKRLKLINVVLNASSIRNEDTINEKFRKLGLNTGNLIFVNAAKEQFTFTEELWFSPDIKDDKDTIYLMPCSCFVHASNKWIESLVDLLEHNSMQIIPIGLGAQANLHTSPKSVVTGLSLKQKRFFQIISERTKSVGVRGEFTAECLELMGIKNSCVMGCPSAFGQQNVIDFKNEPTVERLLMTVTPFRGRISSKVLKLGMENRAGWIMQSAAEMAESYSSNEAIRMLQKLRRFPGSGVKLYEILSYQEQMGKIFWNYSDWKRELQKGEYTFAFGSRFHGNMMAHRNGIPTVWFVHDMRTKELVEWLHLPYVLADSKEFKKIHSVQDIISVWEKQIDDYKRAYSHKYCIYQEFLRENNVFLS